VVRIHSPRPFICNSFKDLERPRVSRPRPFCLWYAQKHAPPNLRHRLANGFPLRVDVSFRHREVGVAGQIAAPLPAKRARSPSPSWPVSVSCRRPVSPPPGWRPPSSSSPPSWRRCLHYPLSGRDFDRHVKLQLARAEVNDEIGGQSGALILNLTVPEGAPTGGAVPVTLTIGTAQSPSGVTIAVK
jgi:hypothetical protein